MFSRVAKTLASAGAVALAVGTGCYAGLDADAGAADAGLSAGDDGDSGDAGEGDDNAPEGFEPSPAAMQRLTTQQYVNSIADVFDLDVADMVALDVDETSAMFRSMGAAVVGTSPSGVEKYRNAAFAVAASIFNNRAAYPWLADCAPADGMDPCVRDALAEVGLRLWRRPLEPEELDRYVALIDAPYEDGQDPELGFEYALAALIESPNFMYLPFVGESAPNGMLRYTAWEQASRLSYGLWNTTPDEDLLQAAADGSLATAEGVADQARRMLADTRAQGVLVRFFGEAWNVERLTLEGKNPSAFPGWSQATMSEYQTEFRLVLERMMQRDGDVRELFNGTSSFASPALAERYGLAPGNAAEAVEGEFTEIALGARRHGLLTSGAVLAANSPSDRSSPTIRGVFILERLLCGAVPPPPADVDDTLPTDNNNPRSTREVLEEHRANPRCEPCHSKIDPLGLVLEHYDGVGLWRDDEDGFEIDPSGEYEGEAFAAAADLARFLADDPRATECLVRNTLAFVSGRQVGTSDAPTVMSLADEFEASGYRMRELLVAVVSSASFRYLSPTAGS